MENRRQKKTFLQPLGRRLNNISSDTLLRSAEAILRSESSSRRSNGNFIDSNYDDASLAPVMPAIDAVQQLLEEESRHKLLVENSSKKDEQNDKSHSPRNLVTSTSKVIEQTVKQNQVSSKTKSEDAQATRDVKVKQNENLKEDHEIQTQRKHALLDEEESLLVRVDPLSSLMNSNYQAAQEEYELIPKSVILDVYSNDPEVKRFLKQLPKVANECGYNEQDYKCYSCRRPIGLVFGQSRLCYFDGHHYCSECHLDEKSTIPARVLCNWDFTKYPISKRNQHFLTLISNEPMFELKVIAPLMYKTCPELREVEGLRCQAFFIRSYCFTCVQETISFELTKLVWPREHLIKQIDLYSLEDLMQIKNGALNHVLRNVITFGRQHVLSCVLCCQKGFICELCKSSQIIYPFDTESVYRCGTCQSIYHKSCFKTIQDHDGCPRCKRLEARRGNL